jgi:RNA polymerase sigma factor (sigma-70 family)
MTVKEAYELYLKDRSPESRDRLGAAFFRFIQAIIATKYGKQFYYLEDVVGDSALKILKWIDNPENNVKDINSNWVYTVVVNTCLDSFRKRTRQRENAIFSDIAIQDSHDLFTKLSVRSALASLTPEERIIAEQLTDGLTGAKAAVELGVSERTIDTRRKEVKLKLRTLLGGGGDD